MIEFEATGLDIHLAEYVGRKAAPMHKYLIKPTHALMWIAVLTWSQLAQGRVILRNDSAEPGAMVAFYGQLQGGDAFTSIFDVPDSHPDYRVCRVLVWIGPAGFNLFSVRIAEANQDGNEIGVDGLLWQSDLDAYQFFGSQNELNSLDLNGFNIRSQARRLRVNIRHIEGQDAPPTIASDTDGIQPGQNQVLSFVRNQGRRVRFFTEDLNDDVRPLRPPGDWIMRVEIVHPDQECPGELDPIVDAGVPSPPQDAGVSPPNMDAGRDPMPDPMMQDSSVSDLDMALRTSDMEVTETMMQADSSQSPGQVMDAAFPQSDASPANQNSIQSENLELLRVFPTSGPSDRNTEIVLTGRGFVNTPPMIAQIGDERLLEVEFLSGSTLSALVPAGLEPGRYDIRLTRSLDGQVAILPSIFEITGPPDGADRSDGGIEDTVDSGTPQGIGSGPSSSSCSAMPGRRTPPESVALLFLIAICCIRRR